MDATNQFTTMGAAATIAPIMLRSDGYAESLYLTEKNTFLEFMTDEPIAAKGIPSALRRGWATPDLTPRASIFCQSPESGFSDNKVNIPELQLPIARVETIQNAELQSSDSTPRWCPDQQLPNAALLSPDKESANSTPRWNGTYSGTYTYEKEACSDKKIDPKCTNNKDGIKSSNVLDEFWASRDGDSQCMSWADQSEDLQTPESTPRWSWSNACGEAYNPQPVKEAGNSRRPSWSDQSEGSVTPDTTPHNAYAYGATDKSQTAMGMEKRRNSVPAATVPIYTVMPIMCVAPTQVCPSLPPSAPVTPGLPQAAWGTEQILSKALNNPLPRKMQPQVVKARDTTSHISNQGQPKDIFNETAASPSENEGMLTLSLNSLLLGGLKQSTVKPAQCATWGSCAEGKTETQPQARTGSKKQEQKKGKKVVPNPAGGSTTLMMRGIPCGLSSEDLMSLLDEAGLKGHYDFFYLPKDSKKNANLGYAFVNFVDVQSAEHCTNKFQGVRLAPFRSAKSCSVAVASIQGLANLSAHFKTTGASRTSHGPMFLNVSERQ